MDAQPPDTPAVIAPSPAPATSAVAERSAFQLGFVGFRARSVDAPADILAGPLARRRFQTFGVSLLQTDVDARSGAFTYHGGLDLALGGGTFDASSSTIDFVLRGAAMFGAVTGHDGGVFARGGVGFDLSGTRGAARELIEAPRIEIGSQWMKGPLFLEVGPSAGLAIVNAAVFDGNGVNVGVQPTLGGFVVVQHTARTFPSSRLRLELVRSETDGHSASGLVTARGRLCTKVYGPFVVCAEGDVMTANATVPLSDDSGRFRTARETATSFGLTVALGDIGMTATPSR